VVEIRQLRYFVVIAEELHFGRAALRLHISQPALSSAVQKLESDVGVRLLERTTRMIALTDGGRAFYVDAREVLRQVDVMLENARTAANGEAGVLAVGYSPAIRETAGKVIGFFAAEHPRVEMLHRQEGSHQLIAAVEEGGLDVAIAIAPPTAASLSFTPLRDTAVTCRMRDDHELATESAVSLDQLPFYSQVLVASQAPIWNAAVERLMDQLGLAVTFRRVQDPIGGEVPADVLDDGEQALLLQPIETPSADGVLQLPLSPSVVCRVDLICRSGQTSASTRLFVAHALCMRDQCGWLSPGSPAVPAGPLRIAAGVAVGM
jgi:DNA-binding transcriptional LysR family regulator